MSQLPDWIAVAPMRSLRVFATSPKNTMYVSLNYQCLRQMIVIGSIHQPSTNTLLLFDNVLLLSKGRTVYYGSPANTTHYFAALGHPAPPMLSPAEFMLELTNTDFDSQNNHEYRVTTLCEAWDSSLQCKILH